MRILVLGGDGYLGWPTALHLSRRGHEVGVVDNFARRQYDYEMGVDSLVPIRHLQQRVRVWEEVSGLRLDMYVGDLTDAAFVKRVVTEFEPEAVVHFAEQRSAPYSMIDQKHAVYTQVNNVVGHAEPALRHRRDRPGHPSGQAGHDGRVRDAEHRHRRGLHRDHPPRPDRRAAVPEAARLLLPPVQGARQPQHHVRLPDLGPPVDRPQPGHRLRPGDAGDRRSTRTWRPGSTTTASSGPSSTGSASRPSSGTR